MMNRRLVIILDAAHGKDVAGKCSPDGFKEYKWSRQLISKLKPRLESAGFRVELSNSTENEIGLSKRAEFATALEVNPGQTKFLLSLHNNATGNGRTWGDATGYEIWSYKNPRSVSYRMAEFIISELRYYFPELKMRVFGPKNLVKQQNFTVLMGAGYYAALLEWLFMDTKSDLAKLRDKEYNDRLVEALTEIFIDLDDELDKFIGI